MKCDECEKEITGEKVIVDRYDVARCPDCGRREYCDRCENLYLASCLDDGLCPSCQDNIWKDCTKCGAEFHENDDPEDTGLCMDCQPEVTWEYPGNETPMDALRAIGQHDPSTRQIIGAARELAGVVRRVTAKALKLSEMGYNFSLTLTQDKLIFDIEGGVKFGYFQTDIGFSAIVTPDPNEEEYLVREKLMNSGWRRA